MKLFLLLTALVAAASCAEKAAKLSSFDLQAAFNMVDTDMNGEVSAQEFTDLYTRMDGNADGKVSSMEFVISFMKTGMSAQGSLYLFFRTDDDNDGQIDSTERDNTFATFDVDSNGAVSYAEYGAVMNKMLGELAKAKTGEPKVNLLFDSLDVDRNGSLTAAEMSNLITAMDDDIEGDGLVSKDEFVKFWMARTGEDQVGSEIMFGFADIDSDGFFGNDAELTNLFNSFDANGDTMVTRDEYNNALLSIFARIQAVRDVQNSVIGFFF